MKERIVLDFGAELKNICNGCAEGVKAKCKQTQKDHLQCALQKSELEEFEVEKYPTSWEELKELCFELPNKIEYYTYNEEELIGISGMYFWQKGRITHNIYNDGVYVYAKNRTPAQMWQIIKSLIGEE